MENKNVKKVPKPVECAIINCELVDDYVQLNNKLKKFEDENNKLMLENSEINMKLKEGLSSEQIEKIEKELQTDSRIQFYENKIKEKDARIIDYEKRLNEKITELKILNNELISIQNSDEKQFKIKELDSKIFELETKVNELKKIKEGLDLNIDSFDSMIKIKNDIISDLTKKQDEIIKMSKKANKELNSELNKYESIKRKVKILSWFTNKKEKKNMKRIEKLQKEIGKYRIEDKNV